MEIRAYAKINLLLAVGEQRADGYHEIESVMQSVSLFDRLSFIRTENKKIELSCSRPYIPCDDRNLAVKAALAFFQHTAISCDGLHITLQKNIPVGAGLGGGSSDAAAVLRALNTIYHAGLTSSELETIASGIGADVAFCIRGGSMLAQGIGERLSPAPPLPSVPILLVKPAFPVPTPKAYAAFDIYPKQSKPDSNAMLHALKSRSVPKICSCLANSLEAPVSALYPQISEIKSALLDSGAQGALMSGAGSTVFGIFQSFSAARQALKFFPKRFGRCFLCTPIKGENHRFDFSINRT